ncbi:MAG: 7-carboxy-7-deazaguanine synthase QueE [Bacteroidia bacterium]
MEEFFSIQGEGFNTGEAAYFIRIGGCDIGCHWCDVKESWDANTHPLIDIESVIQNVINIGAKSVVITGGEPLIYNLNLLTSKLKTSGIRTFLETSGAYQLSGQWDWICLSPKKNVKPISEMLQKANELKVIVYNQNDFLFAEENAKAVPNNCYLYLQPEWSKTETILPFVIDYVKNNPKWRISLQTHKYMNIP